jgi:hypothetical protein
LSANQSGRQAAVRAITGTTLSYEGDFHALFDAQDIPVGPFNQRLLAFINDFLGASYTSLPGAQNAYAVSLGFRNWDSLNTWDATTYDPDAEAYFAAAGVDEEPYLSAINQFVLDLKAASAWTDLDWLFLHANQDATAALTCLRSLTLATPQNSPVLTAGRGYTFNGTTQYLDTGKAPSAGTAYTLNAATFGVDIRTSTASAFEVPIGTDSAADNQTILSFGGGGATTFYATINNIDALTISGTHGGRTGLWQINRSANNAAQGYKNGASIGTGSTASGGRSSRSFFVGAQNGNGTPIRFFTGQISMSYGGGSFDSTKAAAFKTARDTLKASIGY